MSGRRGLNSKIEQAIRRRQKRPVPRPVELGPVSHATRDALTNNHPYLLLRIEHAALQAWRNDPEVDDAAVMRGIRYVLLRDTADDPQAESVRQMLVSSLAQYVSTAGPYFDPERIEEALRIILESVQTRNKMHGGPRGYLTFIDTTLPAHVPGRDWEESLELLESGRSEEETPPSVEPPREEGA